MKKLLLTTITTLTIVFSAAAAANTAKVLVTPHSKGAPLTKQLMASADQYFPTEIAVDNDSDFLVTVSTAGLTIDIPGNYGYQFNYSTYGDKLVRIDFHSTHQAPWMAYVTDQTDLIVSVDSMYADGTPHFVIDATDLS